MAVYTNGTWSGARTYSVARVSKVKDDAHIFDLVDTANIIKQGANLKAGALVTGEFSL